MRGVGTERRKSSGPCTREGELFVGGVDRHHSGRGTASNNILSKSAIATADIEPSKALWEVEPGEESFAYKTAPTAHHPLIGFSVSEKLSFVQVDRPNVFTGDFAALYLRLGKCPEAATQMSALCQKADTSPAGHDIVPCRYTGNAESLGMETP